MATAIGARPIDQAIRAIPPAWFRPDARVYWIDLVGSAALGWSGFALGIVAHRPSIRAAGLIVAAFALYRAVLFIHELTHLAAHELRAFRVAWNVFVGVPLLLPSFLYEGVHTDHHRQRSYGTARDPEYVPFAWQPPAQIAVYGIASIFVPIALAIRFGIVAPLSWIVPPLRRVARERLSALVINHRYVRRAPFGTAALIEEAAATAFVWSAFALWLAGPLPGRVIVYWFGVSAAASLVNAIRTLAAHRYDHHAGAGVTRDARSDSMTEQLLDSCTIAPQKGGAGALLGAWRALWAPVGLRYHALHHWIPSLPYHNLGRAHRLLASTLGADEPYVATQYPGMAPIVIDLWRRARDRSSR